MKSLFSLLLLTLIIYNVKGAKILGIFNLPARSHYILGSSLMRGLAEAGHDVTFVSSIFGKKPLQVANLKQIELTGFYEDMRELLNGVNMFDLKDNGIISELLIVDRIGTLFTKKTLEHPEVISLINSNEEFDVVIVEQFVNEALKMFALRFKAPLVILSTLGPNVWVNNWVANPAPPSYVVDVFSKYPAKMDFWQRLQNTFFYTLTNLMYNFYTLPQHRALAKEHFPNLPPLDEILYNTSIILLNSHPSMNQPVPLVPNMIEIGGYHLKPSGNKLPKDLQDLLDNAKEGVVYFSMGSNLQSAQLPPEKRDAFLNNFRKLKQQVIWKWEDDSFPNQPPNLKLVKWAPQQEILEHPNVKLFITHGGLLSTTETIAQGVPVLAIPVFGDQAINAANAENRGYGLSIPFGEVNERNLGEKLNEILNNPKYGENAKRRSRIFHDREVKPMERAVFWVEYVIKHKGAPHLRVEGVNLPWYKYLLLDVVAFVVFASSVVLVILWTLLRILCCRKAKEAIQKGKGSKLKEN